MTAWEDRVAARTATRRAEAQAIEDAAYQLQVEQHNNGCPDSESFVGTCGACGDRLEFHYSPVLEGIVDIGIGPDTPGGDPVVYTWIYHRTGPLPECGLYAHRVYRTTNPNLGRVDT